MWIWIKKSSEGPGPLFWKMLSKWLKCFATLAEDSIFVEHAMGDIKIYIKSDIYLVEALKTTTQTNCRDLCAGFVNIFEPYLFN